MTFFLAGPTGDTVTARGLLPPYTSVDVTGIATTEIAPGLYSGTLPTKTPAARYEYLIIFNDGTEDVGWQKYLFDGTKQILQSEPVDLSPVKSVVDTLATRLSASRAGFLDNLETVARTATAASYKATGFATSANVTAVITAGDSRWRPADISTLATAAGLTQIKTDILDRGNAAWVTATGFATNAGVWGFSDRTITDKDGFGLSAAAVTALVAAVWSYTGGRLLSGFGNLVTQIWSNSDRELTAPVVTDAASRAASQADLSFLTPLVANGAFTPDALQFAPTGSGGGGALTAEQSQTFSFLKGLIKTDGSAFTLAAFDELDIAAGALTTAERNHLLALPTDALTVGGYTAPASLIDITAAINEAEAAIISQGNTAWATATGFATTNPDNSGILAAITATREAVTALPIPDYSSILSAIADKPVTPITDLSSVLTAIGEKSVTPITDLSPVLTAIADKPVTLPTDLAPVIQAITDKPVTPATDVVAIFEAITAAKAEVIARGDTSWRTATITGDGAGGSVDLSPIDLAIDELEQNLVTRLNAILNKPVTPPTNLAPVLTGISNLGPILTGIGADAAIARKGVTNTATVDKDDNTATIFDDDGVTPIATFDLEPSAIGALIRRKRNG